MHLENFNVKKKSEFYFCYSEFSGKFLFMSLQSRENVPRDFCFAKVKQSHYFDMHLGDIPR